MSQQCAAQQPNKHSERPKRHDYLPIHDTKLQEKKFPGGKTPAVRDPDHASRSNTSHTYWLKEEYSSGLNTPPCTRVRDSSRAEVQ